MLEISQQYPSACGQGFGFTSELLDPDQYADLLGGSVHTPTYSASSMTASYGNYLSNLEGKEVNTTLDFLTSSSASPSPRDVRDDAKLPNQPSFVEPDTTIKSPPPLSTVNHAAISDSNSSAKSDGDSSTSDDTSPPSAARRKGGKVAMKRTIYTQAQLAALERRFIQQSFLSREERQELAASLNISERQVMVWFQNRRGRLKKRGSADTAYNPLKLNELNTRRPYPFLYGMLSSMHYQTGPNPQQVWSMYPEDVKSAASTALHGHDGSSSSKTSPVGGCVNSSPESCLPSHKVFSGEDYPPNVVVNGNGITSRDTITSEQNRPLSSSPPMIPPCSMGYPASSISSHQDHQILCQRYSPDGTSNGYPPYPQQQGGYQGQYSGYQQGYHNKISGNSYYCSRSAPYTRPQQHTTQTTHATPQNMLEAHVPAYWLQGESNNLPYNGYFNASFQQTQVQTAAYNQPNCVTGQ